jgi:hypothetical protein
LQTLAKPNKMVKWWLIIVKKFSRIVQSYASSYQSAWTTQLIFNYAKIFIELIFILFSVIQKLIFYRIDLVIRNRLQAYVTTMEISSSLALVFSHGDKMP